MQHLDMLLQDKEAVLFDIDGTLVDSMGIWRDVDLIYLNRYGIKMPEDLPDRLSGLSIAQTADYFRDVLGVQETNEKMIADWNELAYEQYRYHILPKDGALAFVREIARRGIRMAVGTSNTRTLAETILQRMGFLNYISVVITGEDVKIGKPDPFIYLEAARRVQAAPAACLVFEDIPEGLLAGKRAGMQTCAIWDDHAAADDAKKRELADYYIRSFEDIFQNKVEIL